MDAVLFVAGTFDRNGGKPSTIGAQIFARFYEVFSKSELLLVNGGTYPGDLDKAIQFAGGCKFVVWMASVSNDEPRKYVTEVKSASPQCILTTSKRVVEKDYQLVDVLERALRTKSNLTVEFSGERNEYKARVVDPLGNVWVNYTENFGSVGEFLATKMLDLASVTRVSSTSIGAAVEVPNEEQFFKFVQQKAKEFDTMIPKPKKRNRFLGNSSFRCQRGFPSFRRNGLIFVSRRNVSKSFIRPEGFVAVKTATIPVEFYGTKKPSVDTPVQVLLYEHFPKINYMIHGHTYVKDAPTTKIMVPCGGLQEADEVIAVVGDPNVACFAVNLRGHGSIIGVGNVHTFDWFEHIPKPFPEYMQQ